MSWRVGSELFLNMWPLVRSHIDDHEDRARFTARPMSVFVEGDMEPYDVIDQHPELAEAFEQVERDNRRPTTAEALGALFKLTHQLFPEPLGWMVRRAAVRWSRR